MAGAPVDVRYAGDRESRTGLMLSERWTATAVFDRYGALLNGIDSIAGAKAVRS
jgi:hypothetical protein